MRILITGTGGQVDTSVKILGEKLGFEIIRVGRPEVDLSKPMTLEVPIRSAIPDVIISSAAYTAVDKAESEIDVAEKTNGEAPGVLARVARELNIPILHLSTDYVFSGDKEGAYIESDPTGPIGVYGRTKLAGELRIAEETENYVILRTSWVYSPYGNNFVKSMLRLGETRRELNVVADQRGRPTYAPDIAQALLTVAQQIVNDRDSSLRGIFHLSGEGETTWAEFAETIFAGAEKRGRLPVKVNPISTAEYPTPARRPANSRLNTDKLDEIYGIRLKPWQISLDSCLDHLIECEKF